MMRILGRILKKNKTTISFKWWVWTCLTFLENIVYLSQSTTPTCQVWCLLSRVTYIYYTYMYIHTIICLSTVKNLFFTSRPPPKSGNTGLQPLKSAADYTAVNTCYLHYLLLLSDLLGVWCHRGCANLSFLMIWCIIVFIDMCILFLKLVWYCRVIR